MPVRDVRRDWTAPGSVRDRSARRAVSRLLLEREPTHTRPAPVLPLNKSNQAAREPCPTLCPHVPADVYDPRRRATRGPG